MANRRLTGADWSTAGNWGGTKPVDNDAATIAESLDDDVIMSADEGAIDLDLLDVPPTFRRSVGSSTSPLALAWDRARVYGSNGFFFDIDDDGVGAHTNDETEIVLPSPSTPAELGKKAGALAATHWDLLYLHRGNIKLKSSITFTAAAVVKVGYVTNLLNDCTVLIDANAATLATLHMSGGTVTAKNVLTDARIAGGRLIKETTKITTLIMLGGECWYNHEAVGGDATTIEVFSGARLFLSRNSFFKTVSTVIVHPGGYLEYDDSLVTITTLKNKGGTVRTAPWG